MANRTLVRIWQEMDIDEIWPRLMIWGTLNGDCGQCKEIGLSLDMTTCPKCGTAFKYVGMRSSNSVKEAKRVHARRPDLTIIDLGDFNEAKARKKAHGFLGE